MSDSDSARRRPQYGEYASPEEQRAAIKQPAEWQLQALETDAAPEHPAPQPPLHGSYQPGPPRPWPQDESRPPQQATRAGFGDRLVTFVLLGFGLSNVLSVVVDAFEGGRVMRQTLADMGDSYGRLADALPAWLWQGQAVIYAVVWLITLFVSLSSMRAGRRSWWIPVVGAIVAGILFFAVFVIALGQHPELMNLVPSETPGGTSS